MTNNSDQKQQKITPASFADELDVYEVLYKKQKKEGLKILSPSQLQLLIDSGRVSKEKTKTINLDVLVSSKLPENILAFIDMIIYGIYLKSAEAVVKEYSIDPSNEVFVKKMAYENFRRMMGLAPNQLKRFYVQEFEKILEEK